MAKPTNTYKIGDWDLDDAIDDYAFSYGVRTEAVRWDTDGFSWTFSHIELYAPTY